MSSYYDKARYLFTHAPASAVREYILTTDIGDTFIELVALKMMATGKKTGDGAAQETNSIYH
jgi:hypothetical protein